MPGTLKRWILPVAIAGLLLQLTTGALARLEPSKEMAAQTRWVMNTINARHYLRESMERLNGEEMVEAYVESIDYAKMYFTREEVDEFIFRFAGAMEAFLEKGNLYAAFEIYETYKARAGDRVEWVYQRLDEDFDFAVDETFRPDRREEDWPVDDAAATALWEQRLKYELLNEVMSLASEETEDEPTLERQNPDVIESDSEEDEFDPEKLRRLVEDEAFLAEVLDEARSKIRRRYERNFNYANDREAAEVQESFINSMTQLFDPHSSFLSADTLESFNSSVQNSFVGIGALLEDDDGYCTIKQILPGGPAERSRELSEEDVILGVGQGKSGEFDDVVDMQLRYIVRKIKGKKGTTVRLLIRPGDAADPSARRVVSIVRDEVKLTANLASATLIEVPSSEGDEITKVGVIELPSFYGNIGAGGTLTTTSEDVKELLDKLREAGAEGIILDLRMNGGGLLTEAVRVAGLFLPVGPVVQVRDKDGGTNVLSDHNPVLFWDGPLVVLTSRFSASASEIVAGALQDHDRAVVVGNHSTHGKGTVQEVYHMNNRPNFAWFQATAPKTRPVASKITIKQFYLPQGSSTQVKGVVSDIALPSVNEFLPIGESDLPHALPWNSIDAVDWVNDWDKVKVAGAQDPALVSDLLTASQTRQEALEEFAFLKEQIEWRRSRIEEKDISLNLADRIERKVTEKDYIDQLDDTYDELKENDYEMTEFLLKVTEEQEAQSQLNLAKPLVNGAETDASEEETPSSEEEDAELAEAEEEEDDAAYDIYLRESARIMADWIQRIAASKTATAKTKVEVDTEAL